MASLSSAGIGSGLDVNSIVSQLVSAERSAKDTQLSKTESKAKVQLSALGSFKGALSNLQSALNALKSGGGISAQSAVSSDTSLFSAAASSAAVGSYSVEVRALARANKLNSDAYASSSAVVGSGTVTLTVDGESFTVTLGASSTVADLRDAINGASGNSGVSAALLNEGGGTRLILTARETGLQNAVSVSSSLVNFTQTQTALDAEVRIEGYTLTSASNTLSGALDGVSLNLLKAEPGTVARLDVSVDQSAMRKAVEDFVTHYNAYLKSYQSLTQYNASAKTASALTGDAALRNLHQQLRGIAGRPGASSGAFQNLAQIGVTSSTDGTLTLNASTLSTAISQDSTAVKNLFAAPSGYASQLSSVVNAYLGSGGQYETATNSLQAKLKDVSKQRDALELRMEGVESRYLKQFTRLDSLISQLRNTSDFLSSQLSTLSSSNS